MAARRNHPDYQSPVTVEGHRVHFQYGNHTACIDNTAQIQPLVQLWDHLDLAARRQEAVRTIRHGHVFNYGRACACGLQETDYWMHMSHGDILCPLVDPHDPLEALTNDFRIRHPAACGYH